MTGNCVTEIFTQFPSGQFGTRGKKLDDRKMRKTSVLELL